MILTIGFNSGEAIYIQPRNQIALEIAVKRIREGDPLSSVRQLTDNIGINMHAVNKAYSMLCQEGSVKLDRGKGMIICLDMDRLQALERVRQRLAVVLATDIRGDVSREEAHQITDEIHDIFQNGGEWTGNSHQISEVEEPCAAREM